MAEIIEGQFSYNEYNGFEHSLVPYDVKLGTKPVLISAPHSVNHMRNNNVKKADLYTGAIASLVQLTTNCLCITSNRISEEDPNYTIDGRYKDAIKEICDQNDIRLVIDLHGAAISREFDIDLGTMHGTSIDETSVTFMKNRFNENKIKDIRLDDTFPASHPGTITHFTSQSLNIDAIQMEVNYRYRNPNNTTEFSALLQSLIDIVEHFGKDSL
ncbi:hypothetical protein [Sporosarcina sp. ACRSL]|uniref:hypothetical protein n=1 Tax=Sporosarcina sp. ACRSL TaxID=2918215 RepID=UPI001EF4F11A|nr:hypothetical protein [Sporosarcina sp. ACRSL]